MGHWTTSLHLGDDRILLDRAYLKEACQTTNCVAIRGSWTNTRNTYITDMVITSAVAPQATYNAEAKEERNCGNTKTAPEGETITTYVKFVLVTYGMGLYTTSRIRPTASRPSPAWANRLIMNYTY